MRGQRDAWKKRTDSLAKFNPDWDMLEATQASLREHMAVIARMRVALQPFADLVHEDGVSAPHPTEVWGPLLTAAKDALQS